MNEHKNQRLTKYSRELRDNMTKEERHLWYDFLKNLPVTFHRQKVFGQYILDFYCASAGIAPKPSDRTKIFAFAKRLARKELFL